MGTLGQYEIIAADSVTDENDLHQVIPMKKIWATVISPYCLIYDIFHMIILSL